MTKADRQVITELETVLTSHEYSPVVVRNYCAYARGFLDHLAQRNIAVTDVTEAQVEQYLFEAVALFQRRHGRLPGPRWHQIPCAGSFRHATAVHLVSAGVDVTVIRSWLGHVSLDTTNHYAKANLETKRKALEQVSLPATAVHPPSWKRDASLLAWLDTL